MDYINLFLLKPCTTYNEDDSMILKHKWLDQHNSRHVTTQILDEKQQVPPITIEGKENKNSNLEASFAPWYSLPYAIYHLKIDCQS